MRIRGFWDSVILPIDRAGIPAIAFSTTSSSQSLSATERKVRRRFAVEEQSPSVRRLRRIRSRPRIRNSRFAFRPPGNLACAYIPERQAGLDIFETILTRHCLPTPFARMPNQAKAVNIVMAGTLYSLLPISSAACLFSVVIIEPRRRSMPLPLCCS